MESPIPALPFAIFMFIGMLAFLEIGRLIGKRHYLRDPNLLASHSSVDGAAFALYGLLLAFTFSGAPSRFDARRRLIGEEANAISTAYLRVDLLAPEHQPHLRELFRNYLDARLAAYRRAHDFASVENEIKEIEKVQRELWTATINATKSSSAHAESGKLLLPAVTEMIDAANNRTIALMIHPPVAIFVLLFGLAQVCSLMAGYGMATSNVRSWVHIWHFPFLR